MIDEATFDKRCKELYTYQRNRLAARKYKSGKLKGTVRVPKRDLPFTCDELSLWLWRKVGLQAIGCPHCGAPIDILNLTLDHIIPIKLGGGLGLDNLDPICADCNKLKDALLPADFILLKIFLASPQLSEVGRINLRSRLLAGSGGLRASFFPHPNKGEKTIVPSTTPRFHPPAKQKSMAFFDDF